MKRSGSPALLVVALATTCSLVAARGEASPAQAPSQQTGRRTGALVFDLPVPGGLDSLFAATRVAPSPRAVALLSLIRILYAHAATAADFRRLSQALESRVKSGPVGPSSDTVPLPLSPDVWTGTIFKGGVTADRLVDAILGDKRASLLYYGLMSVDDATLEYFDTHRPLLARIYDQGVGAFATCARSLHVEKGVVVLPGRDGALPAWEEIVGQRASAPEPFILALFGDEAGRRAYFLDLVTHLDPARQAFALAADYPADRRTSQIRSLYDVVLQFERKFWRFDAWPFARQPFDPAIVLVQVEALPDGRMKAPSNLAVWRAALDGNEDACGQLRAQDTAAVDAAWLVGRLMREPVDSRRLLLSDVLFTQRVFASSTQADVAAVCQVAANFRRFSGLMLTLEHMGFSDPADYLGAVRTARGVAAQSDLRASLLGVAQMQGILAFLDAAAAASPSNRRMAQELVRSLCALEAPVGPAAPPSWVAGVQRGSRNRATTIALDFLAQWVRGTLLARLCSGNEPAESCMQEVAAGVRAKGPPPPLVEWEGQRYRVDPAHAAALRLSQVRQRQESLPFDDILQLLAVGIALRDRPFAASIASEQAGVLQGVADRLAVGTRCIAGGTVDSIRSQLAGTARQLASARQKPPTAAADVLAATHALLADAWASFAYATAIGDADSSLLLAEDPARRHDFGLPSSPSPAVDLSPAWQLAREELREHGGWTIRGSLLGLSRACASSWPRRLSIEPIAARPTLSDGERHGVAELAAALSPFNPTDAGRSAIVAAIERGRALLTTAASNPDEFAARAIEAGVSEWRVRGAAWTVGRNPKGVGELFSLVELLWLGKPDAPREQIDAWGAPSGPFDGSLVVRMPPPHAWENLGSRGVPSMYSHLAEVNLRAALWLDEMKLPAALMPGLAAFATWDLTTSAQPVDADDYLAVARAAQSIPVELFADYLSALTTDGTLAPVSKGR
ncbi:MAG: hypothetical protein ACM3NQ_17010 [Bacteroidales bacterium]